MAVKRGRGSDKGNMAGPESKALSKQITDYCYEKMLELAIVYESVLSSHLKYEDAFYAVMNTLNVPMSEQEKMLRRIINISDLNQLPYHTLSPFNQFHTSSGPYVWYCLETEPPEGVTPAIVNNLLHSYEFSEFADRLSKEISQKVKGALWNPRVRSRAKSQKSKKRSKLLMILFWVLFLGIIILAGFLKK